MIKKILYITMSNLGDAMMGLPAFDFLKKECLGSKITVLAGPRTKCVFENHPDVAELIVYDKYAPLKQKIELFFRFKKEQFDVVVDLKDTFYRWGILAKYKNPPWIFYPSWVAHSAQKHLFKAMTALCKGRVDKEKFLSRYAVRSSSFISVEDGVFVEGLLKEKGIGNDEFILIAPGARSNLKKWHKRNYIEVAREINKKYGYKVVVAGDQNDIPLVEEIVNDCAGVAVGLYGETNFGQLCSLIQRAKVVICNDSGVLHIASYLERPVIGIYGHSDYRKYGPWSKSSIAVRRSVLCAPCGKARCSRNSAECIKTIRPYDVMFAFRLLLESGQISWGTMVWLPMAKAISSYDVKYKRILLVRTDRIGDVLVSTPVIKALRDKYPASYIAMMVSEYTKDIVEGNPYLDKVIVFYKDKKDGGFFNTLAFSKKLRKFNFDLAIILNPAVRLNLICFLAGIKERIGYAKKAPYFLTKTTPDLKYEGLRHESEYNFDLLKPLGIEATNREFYMPIKAESERFVSELLVQSGIKVEDRIVAIHPSASNIQRRWPLDRFAQIVDKLAVVYGVKVVVVADEKYSAMVDEVIKLSEHKPINFCGKLDLTQLASLFKKCALVISNISGPAHLAGVVGTPVISISGSSQPGLGFLRWRTFGKLDVFINKNIGCKPCFPDDCQKQFKCLEAISVEEVLGHVGRVLNKVINS